MRGPFQSLTAATVIVLGAGPGAMAQEAIPQEGASPSPALTENVRWARAPRPELPGRVRASGVHYAVVELNCGFRPDGALNDCRVLREEPEDMGLARAALSAAARARLAPSGLTDALPDGRIQFSLRFLTP